jgi:hypothetical protein
MRFTFSIAVPDDPTFMKGWPMKSAAVTCLSECEAVEACEKALSFFVVLLSGSDERDPVKNLLERVHTLTSARSSRTSWARASPAA